MALMQFRRNAYLIALQPLTYRVPYVAGLHYTSLKHRSPRTQAVFIAGFSFVLTLILLLAGWIRTL
jgi:hypothetical protein